MADEKEGISLKMVVGGILQSLREAKHIGDVESARLVDIYKKEPRLSLFSVPAFAISDVEVELRFAVSDAGSGQNCEGNDIDVKVCITPDAIKELNEHQMSVMKLKLSPVSLRVFEADE